MDQLYCKKQTLMKFYIKIRITLMQKDCAVMYACACLPSYNGICLMMNVLACPAMHLCVTLGKKARLHLMFSLTKAKSCHLY